MIILTLFIPSACNLGCGFAGTEYGTAENYQECHLAYRASEPFFSRWQSCGKVNCLVDFSANGISPEAGYMLKSLPSMG
ncbi:MAG: hypothetical protein CMJ74_09695 [Planctomycetaceae bacterium]|nr:hypothetical protein [Planctomycetaceae bacterium]